METTDTLEIRLQRRMHVSLYALLFLTALLGFSVLLDGCVYNREVKNTYLQFEPSYAMAQDTAPWHGLALCTEQGLKAFGPLCLAKLPSQGGNFR